MGCNCNKDRSAVSTPILQKVIKGSVGLVKAGMGIGLAKSALIAQRREICSQCDRLRSLAVDTCSVCNCVIIAKTRLNEEKCPLGKW